MQQGQQLPYSNPPGLWDRFKLSFNNQSTLIKVVIVIAALFSCCCLCSLPASFFQNNSTSASQDKPNAETQIAEVVNTQLTESVDDSVASQNPAPTQPIIQENKPTPFQPAVQVDPQQVAPAAAPANVLPAGQAPISSVSGMLKVTFIDVGQGDSILIQTPDGKFGLIDGGDEGSNALAYLQSRGVSSLDVVIATHPHSDHIGGLIQILKTIPTANIVTNGQSHTTGTYEAFLDAALASNAKYFEAKRGDYIPLGGVALKVLSPVSPSGSDMNENSLVLKLDYGNAAFLFMGDANQDIDRELLSSGQNVLANILKVGHHASGTSTAPEFLAAVQPQIAVYSAGIGNDYDHPAQVTKDLFNSLGIQFFGTDVYGTITISTDGSAVNVEKEKEPNQAPVVAPPVENQAPVAVAEDLQINVITLSSPTQKGDNASLAITTSPGANCSIKVIYKSGPSNAAGLGSKTADQSGNVSWSWKVGSKTTSGVWNINVTCQANGKSVSQNIPFEVR